MRALGRNFGLKADGAGHGLAAFVLGVAADEQALAALQRVLANKRAVMSTPEGRVLTKEMLIRRLEFFNETARQVNVMRTQQSLGSPSQYVGANK